ncbi:MAG: DHH family phosphoesterase [Thermoplasmata archaeon]|nr:MAG: DHH family phosphoesterase [Thermoplasmata archaeon]
MAQLLSKAKEIADYIDKKDDVLIITHIDADGIAAGSIASLALKRKGIEHEIRFVKKLDESEVERVKNDNPDLVWFTDLGSGSLPILDGLDAVITDHHVPAKTELTREDRIDILKFASAIQNGSNLNNNLHLNPHLIGLDGANDLSGAGSTYLVAKMMDKKNTDLSALAIVGAVGDLQDAKHLKLVGTNRDVLQDGKDAGVLLWKKDIRYFGRETRPVFKLLQYANDPIIPYLTGKEDACINFLLELGISLKIEEEWRRWIDLTLEEKREISSEIVKLLLSKGFGHEIAKRLIGEVYILNQEEEGTELRDAKEYATLLNSCGRYEKAEVGYNVCLGDREEWLDRALVLLRGHRRTLVDMLLLIKESGITEMGHIQYFHGHDKIPENIVGTLAGMLLGGQEVRGDLPIFGFALTSEGDIKVSARGTRILVNKGLDLSVVMKESSEKLGGVGGGHNIASGATIPKGSEEEFLKMANKLVKKQISG